MVFKLRPTSFSVVRPRVTPDPDRAAELQRRMMALTYYPENGFHRDLRQQRQASLVADRFGRMARVSG